jgi:cobalamin-dependent methionine synthase I
METTLCIGEKLNSSRFDAKRIFTSRDANALLSLARAQIEGGASLVDINAALLMGEEEAAMRWAARLVHEQLGVRTMIDSADVDLLLRAAAEFGAQCIINSLPCDAETLDAALPPVSRSGAGAVVMLKGRSGIPPSLEAKMALAEMAVARGKRARIPAERLFIDPIVLPLATTTRGAAATFESLRELAKRYPEHPRIVGLSNVSFGLPERRLVNRTFAAMLTDAGATALICDTTDAELMKTLAVGEALVGRDTACKRFLSLHRTGRADT